MQLVKYLNTVISENTSYVQAYLAKEDLARIEKLQELATSSLTEAAYKKDGLYIEWTKGDFRTHELAEPLNALMDEIYILENSQLDEQEKHNINAKIMDIWAALHTLRLKTVVHCL
jgi:hypothetical protein